MKLKQHQGIVCSLAAAALACAATGIAAPAIAQPVTPPLSSHSTESVSMPRIIPAPQSMTYHHDKKGYTLTTKTCIHTSGDNFDAALSLLRHTLSTSYGMKLPSGNDCSFSIILDKSLRHSSQDQSREAYQLEINSEGITLRAATSRAAIWGAQTLLQIIGPWADAPTLIDDHINLPAVSIVDQPRYAWRGIMIDPARSFIPVPEVKHLIDIMSSVKLNVLHIHLTDDQGWRIEITNANRQPGDTIDYSRLTKLSGSTAMEAGESSFTPLPGRSGFYTQQEFVGLVKYAAEHGISVIPEIDGPGHTASLLYAIPQLNTQYACPNPKDPSFCKARQGYGQSTVDSQSDVTYQFMSYTRAQVAALVAKGMAEAHMSDFYLPYFHIGGDESFTTHDYLHYMEKMSDQFRSLPIKPIVWNDALGKAENVLTDGTLIQYWTTGSTGVDAQKSATWAAQHHSQVIMSPVRNTYFPQRGSGDVAGPAWGCPVKDAAAAKGHRKWCDTHEYYDWDPAHSFDPYRKKQMDIDENIIRGIEGPLWNEHMRTEHDQQFQMFPRAFALAEVGWTPQQQRHFEDFRSRVMARGIDMIERGATFQLASELAPWQGSVHGTVVDTSERASDSLIALIALPGLTSTDKLPQKATIRDASGKDIPVTLRYDMPQSFHYTDPEHTTGRIMNSLVKVYAQLPHDISAGVASVHLGTVSGIDRVAALPLDFTMLINKGTAQPPKDNKVKHDKAPSSVAPSVASTHVSKPSSAHHSLFTHAKKESHHLAQTGSYASFLLLTGLLALGSGAVLIVMRRRRS